MSPPLDPKPLADGDPAQVITSAWSDQALWSAVATKIGDSIRWWRVVAAAAGLGGLFLSILAGTMTGADQSTPRMALTTVGVLLLALVPYLRQRLVSPERVQAWTTARNVSEQLKEAIYRHLMGVLPPEPLADGSAPPDAAGPGNLVPLLDDLAERTRSQASVSRQLSSSVADRFLPQSEARLREILAQYVSLLVGIARGTDPQRIAQEGAVVVQDFESRQIGFMIEVTRLVLRHLDTVARSGTIDPQEAMRDFAEMGRPAGPTPTQSPRR